VSTRLAAHEICLASCLSVKADVKMLKPRQTKPSQPPWYFFYFLFFQVSSSPEPWHHFSSDYERLWIAPTAAEQGLTKWFQQKTYYFSVLVSPSPPQFFSFSLICKSLVGSAVKPQRRERQHRAVFNGRTRTRTRTWTRNPNRNRIGIGIGPKSGKGSANGTWTGIGRQMQHPCRENIFFNEKRLSNHLIIITESLSTVLMFLKYIPEILDFTKTFILLKYNLLLWSTRKTLNYPEYPCFQNLCHKNLMQIKLTEKVSYLLIQFNKKTIKIGNKY